ncbi:hypothetical protein [Pontibacter chitinilyticus]|uniref:hypothetical protein n=1 Tax=Pontibacter chitinilyticus TaxID=2674989 RepID=UPI00321BA0F3
MKTSFRTYFSALLLGTILIGTTSCGSNGGGDDPAPVDDQELITDFTITLVPEGKGQNVSATFSDPDGAGGAAPTVSALNLAPNTTYTATITLKDGNTDVTSEVKNKSTEHEFFYETLNTPTGPKLGENLIVTDRDLDTKGLPLGLQATITTQASSSGTLRITLKHQPGLKSSTSTSSVGETDAQADFPVVIQ